MSSFRAATGGVSVSRYCVEIGVSSEDELVAQE